MTQVAVLCDGRILSPSGTTNPRRCRFRARWWVATYLEVRDPRAMCGVHARGWMVRWPILSLDPAADRAALVETFS